MELVVEQKATVAKIAKQRTTGWWVPLQVRFEEVAGTAVEGGSRVPAKSTEEVRCFSSGWLSAVCVEPRGKETHTAVDRIKGCLTM